MATLLEWRQRFKGKAISALNAYACCRRGKLVASQFLLQLADFVEEAARNQYSQALALPLPRQLPIVRVAVRPDPVSPRIGFLELSSGTWAIDAPAPRTQPELDTLRKFLEVGSDVLRRDTDDCGRCVQRRIWRQTKKRVRVKLVRRKPGVSNLNLMLRKPHR